MSPPQFVSAVSVEHCALRVIILSAALIAALPSSAESQPSVGEAREVITEIRVHGNTATSDEEIRRESGLVVGAPVAPDVLTQAAERLRATKRFDRVEVLKRYASIADPTQVIVLVLVDEGPVRIVISPVPGQIPRIVRRRDSGFMVMPLLDGEDGYGLSYGARLAFVNVAGANSRLSFPLTWGGDKRAAGELEKQFARGPISRAIGGVAVQRRTHPFFEQDADRRRIWARAERNLGHSVRVGGDAGWQRVSFLRETLDVGTMGMDVVLDTRLDPALPRNAVYARAAVERLAFSNASAQQTQLEGRGYIGLVGQTVLVVRAQRDDANRPVPPYFKSILGGTRNLRGFRAGTAVGDTLLAGSVELRIPLTSPLRIGKVGVNAFVDTGTTYDKGQRLRDQALKTGIGGGIWFSAAVFHLNVAVAHGVGASTRVHFSVELF